MREIDPYKERRQAFAGAIAVSALIGSALIASSQTTVTLKNGRLLETSLWHWPLELAIAAFCLFSFLWFSTYYSRRLIPARFRLFSPDVQYSVGEDSMSFQFTNVTASDCTASVAVRIKNFGPLVIEVEVQNLHVNFGSGAIESKPEHFTKMLLPPGTTRQLTTAGQRNIALDHELSASFELSMKYGSPYEEARYDYHHICILWIDGSLRTGINGGKILNKEASPVTDRRIEPKPKLLKSS